MPTPPSGYGYYVRYYGPLGNQRTAAIGFGFRNNPGNVASATIGAMRTAVSSSGRIFDPNLLGDSWEWRGDYMLINQLNVLTSAASTVAITGSATGLDSPPPNVSMVIRKNTDRAGRQFRGRLAYPAGFLDETTIDADGNFGSGVRTAWQGIVNATMSALSAATFNMALIHGPDKLGVTPLPTLVTTVEVQQLVGTQRRRLR